MSSTTVVKASDFADVYAEAHIEFESGDSGEAVDRPDREPDRDEDPDPQSVRAAEESAPPEAAGAESMSSLNDEELLVGIRTESELHFAELYNRYFQRIYSFVYTRLRNHADTEEVVQETFLAVFRSFERYRGQSSLLSWIYGIAKNTANSNIRRSKSMTERIDLADDEDLMPRPSLTVGSPAEQLDLNRFRDQLSQRLAGLADWQAEIFEMRHFENLSIPEISRRTARSSDAVRSSLYRVKRLFFEAADTSGATGVSTEGLS
ncbi:MAG: RNA polymerase sigma factor [Myxococcales bacterium]|nr:RNA polymerase sigma factor [Myxococcales bacterium]HIK85404.1 RNA polymerase sigma factor [Myxococcales bacterium]